MQHGLPGAPPGGASGTWAMWNCLLEDLAGLIPLAVSSGNLPLNVNVNIHVNINLAMPGLSYLARMAELIHIRWVTTSTPRCCICACQQPVGTETQ